MTTLQPISIALIKSAITMRLKIFLIFIIFVKFSFSQVVFPDATTTTTPKPTTTTEMMMTTKEETTEEPMEEATGEETTEEQVKTDMTTTEVIPVTKAVTICAAIHQCQNIDGRTEDDGTGKMDVRVNNVSPDFQNFWLIFN